MSRPIRRIFPWRHAGAAVLIGSLFACSSAAPPPGDGSAADAAPAASPAPAPGTGRVTGTAPRPGPGTEAIVLLEPKTSREFPPPEDTPVMDQAGETFGPDVLIVRTGYPVEFRNSDDVLHNVHVSNEDTHDGGFNVAIPTGHSYRFTFQNDGFYHVGCDIHPAMSAEIVATSSPYATLADADGGFELTDVAPGAYSLTVYANGKKVQRDVEVKPGENDLRVGGGS